MNEETLIKSLGDFGIVATLFVVFMLGLFYTLFKFIPKAWKAHIELIAQMQEKFSKDLSEITSEHAVTNRGFLDEIKSLNKDHEKQNDILNKLDKKQDKIHDDIIACAIFINTSGIDKK